MNRVAVCIPIALFVTACAAPSVLLSRASTTVMEARTQNLVGQHVRWGGTVANVTPTERGTCFEIVDRPLDRDGTPLHGQQPDGRFLACTPQIFPRGVYEGQDSTVSGTLEPTVTETLIGLKYRYPRVAITELNFWPRTHYSSVDRDGSRWWEPPEQGSQGYWW